MSWTSEITLWCSGCMAWERVRETSVARSRAIVGRLGWTYTRSPVERAVLDRCKACSAKSADVRPAQHDGPRPHGVSCPGCRATNACNVCGDLRGTGLQDAGCTNGRCQSCHREVCPTHTDADRRAS